MVQLAPRFYYTSSRWNPACLRPSCLGHDLHSGGWAAREMHTFRHRHHHHRHRHPGRSGEESTQQIQESRNAVSLPVKQTTTPSPSRITCLDTSTTGDVAGVHTYSLSKPKRMKAVGMARHPIYSPSPGQKLRSVPYLCTRNRRHMRRIRAESLPCRPNSKPRTLSPALPNI